MVCTEKIPKTHPERISQQSAAYFLLFQIPSLLLKVIQWLLASSSSSCLPLYLSICPSITCFRREFLRKMWPIILAFLQYIVCTTILSSSRTRNTSSFFTYRSKWHPPSLSSTKSQTFQGIPDSLNKMPKFQRHTYLCSNYSTLPVPSLNWNPFHWWKEFSSCWMLLCYGTPECYFTCTSCITRYKSTHRAETFHILELFLIYRNLYSECSCWNFH